jgi:hypothetical protein
MQLITVGNYHVLGTAHQLPVPQESVLISRVRMRLELNLEFPRQF